MSGQEAIGRPLVQHSVSTESLSRQGLSSRISSISDMSEAAGSLSEPYDPQASYNDYRSPQTSMDNLQNQNSSQTEASDISHVLLTSRTLQDDEARFSAAAPTLLPTLPSGPPPSLSSANDRNSWPSNDYEPLSPGGSNRAQGGIGGRLRTSLRSFGGKRAFRPQAIPEEGDEMEIGLVGRAYSFGHGGTSYATVEDIEENEEEENLGIDGFDVTSFTGPMSEVTVAEERHGKLTGGLGVGAKPDIQISSRDLVANSPTSPRRGLSRSLSRRPTQMARPSSSVRQIAQAEANRLGRVIEVVVEDGSDTPPKTRPRSGNGELADDTGAGIDLSSFGGGADDFSKGDVAPASYSRHATNQLNRAIPLKREIFYPAANWKPHSMRWPYLFFLVFISGGLSGVQEYIYQMSTANRAVGKGLFTFTDLDQVSTWDYFTFKYLPTMLAVTFGILWQLTDFEVKRLEAYYQLSKPGGALAAESINVDYITVFSFLRPILALRLRHWAVAISSLTTALAVSAVPILQSASIIVIRGVSAGEENLVVVSRTWSRFLSAVLGVIAVFGLVLLIMLQSRKSGLMNDVKGIAGIAAMATKSHILMDFKDLDTAPPHDIHMQLKNHRYTLRNSSLAPNKDDAAGLSSHDKNKYDTNHLSPNPHPFMLRLPAGISLIVGMVAFMVFLPLVLFVRGANVVTDKASWFLTACAVLIKIAYQTLEQDLRMMEPFYRLSIRHASPKVLTLDYTGMAFGYMPLRALWNGDLLVAMVGTGSVLAEILTVCVTSFAGIIGAEFLPGPSTRPPNSDSKDGNVEETQLSFWVSFIFSMVTLFYLMTTAALVYWRRRHPFLPRQPSTIASVLAYIHQSKMLYDFVDEEHPAASTSAPDIVSTAYASNLYSSSNSTLPIDTTKTTTVTRRTGRQDVDNDEMVRRLVVAGKTYGLGWFTGRDGQTHCGVDVEELKGSYEHKVQKDARLATMPWLGNWETY